MRLLGALGLFLALLHVTSCLWIGAFNIKNFGEKKTGIKEGMTEAEKNTSKEVMEIITQIVQRYDIILIQEVRCPDGTVTKRLMDLVNKVSLQFRNIVSEPLPLGRIGHKERYLFLYRKETVTVTGSFQYADTPGVFDRPPFVVQFSSTKTGVDFVLIPIHTKPDHAVKEIDALVDVVAASEQRWKNNKNIVVLGDFNAGSRYVGTDDWKKNPLLTNKGFHSLIEDVATTLAEKTIQTHDRIVVSDEMNKGVVAGSAKVFDFIKAYHPVEPEKVSDHFPVEVELDLKPLMKRSRAASGGGDSGDPSPTKKIKKSLNPN